MSQAFLKNTWTGQRLTPQDSRMTQLVQPVQYDQESTYIPIWQQFEG